MAVRKIVSIDEDKCDGCGECVPSCEEGAIQIVGGKARLVSDAYCDGLGACLGHCPRDAISLIERQADDFDEVAMSRQPAAVRPPLPVLPLAESPGGGCPGSRTMQLRREKSSQPPNGDRRSSYHPGGGEGQSSGLANWPVQLRLVPPQAAYLQNADVLLVADCVPFALADFHRRFLDGRPVLVGCPKLDDGRFYVQKLAQILLASRIRSMTVVHMEVPCCTGLVQIARAAVELAGVDCLLREVTISVRGQVVEGEGDIGLRRIVSVHTPGSGSFFGGNS